MNKIIKTSSLLISLTSIVLLNGCTTPGKKLLPHGDMTMAQIYRVQTGLAVPSNTQAVGNESLSSNRVNQASYRRVSKPTMPINDHYTDVAQNQMNSEFKVLPNPNIAAYIFPHIAHYSGTNVPVPGYTTTFFLYEKNHYAMPGEEY